MKPVQTGKWVEFESNVLESRNIDIGVEGEMLGLLFFL